MNKCGTQLYRPITNSLLPTCFSPANQKKKKTNLTSLSVQLLGPLVVNSYQSLGLHTRNSENPFAIFELCISFVSLLIQRAPLLASVTNRRFTAFDWFALISADSSPADPINAVNPIHRKSWQTLTTYNSCSPCVCFCLYGLFTCISFYNSPDNSPLSHSVLLF